MMKKRKNKNLNPKKSVKVDPKKFGEALKSAEKAIKAQELPRKQIIINTVTFKEKVSPRNLGGVSYIAVGSDGKAISLPEFVAVVLSCNGQWMPLGKAFNPVTYNGGMEITLQYIIQEEFIQPFTHELQSRLSLEKR